jgi:hypothetical protein
MSSSETDSGDIEKAFHQISLTDGDRNFQRALWYNNLEERKIVEYRFTKVIFGSTSSPYILGATIEKHLAQYNNQEFNKTIKALQEDTYADDVNRGGDEIDDVKQFKQEATLLVKEGGL